MLKCALQKKYETRELKSLSKNIGLIVLLGLLALIYIANSHKAERKLRDISRLKKEVADAKAKFQLVKSQNTYNTTQSQLKKQLESEGLKINLDKPILLSPETDDN